MEIKRSWKVEVSNRDAGDYDLWLDGKLITTAKCRRSYGGVRRMARLIAHAAFQAGLDRGYQLGQMDQMFKPLEFENNGFNEAMKKIVEFAESNMRPKIGDPEPEKVADSKETS